jgi:predicted nucleotidyltransferase
MTRTALDLTVREWQAYYPGQVSSDVTQLEGVQMARRRQQAWRTARRAARILRQRFGAHKVVAFGSLIHDASFTPWSDIDLAAWGIPPDRFYGAVAAVTGLSAVFKVDLVDLETCRPAVREAAVRDGVEL